MRPESEDEFASHLDSAAEPVVRALWKMYRPGAMEDNGGDDSLKSAPLASQETYASVKEVQESDPPVVRSRSKESCPAKRLTHTRD